MHETARRSRVKQVSRQLGVSGVSLPKSMQRRSMQRMAGTGGLGDRVEIRSSPAHLRRQWQTETAVANRDTALCIRKPLFARGVPGRPATRNAGLVKHLTVLARDHPRTRAVGKDSRYDVTVAQEDLHSRREVERKPSETTHPQPLPQAQSHPSFACPGASPVSCRIRDTRWSVQQAALVAGGCPSTATAAHSNTRQGGSLCSDNAIVPWCSLLDRQLDVPFALLDCHHRDVTITQLTPIPGTRITPSHRIHRIAQP